LIFGSFFNRKTFEIQNIRGHHGQSGLPVPATGCNNEIESASIWTRKTWAKLSTSVRVRS